MSFFALSLVIPIGDPRDGFFFSSLTLMMAYYITGLENCKRPLVFTSGSSVRASGNCHLLAPQDE